jgi:hypothetical protein
MASLTPGTSGGATLRMWMPSFSSVGMAFNPETLALLPLGEDFAVEPTPHQVERHRQR